MKIALNDTPLHTGHQVRGIGAYTRMLIDIISDSQEISLINWNQRKQADFIHYPFFDLYVNSLPLLNLKKTIVTIHDVIPLIFPEQYPVGVRGKINLVKQKWKLRKVGAIITDSQQSKEDIVRYLNLNPARIYVVPLSIPSDIKYPAVDQRNRVLRKYSIPKNYILYVGDINYNKNIPQLIKMMKYLPKKIKLVCVGSNFKPQPIVEWKAIVTQAALSDVESRIIYLPSISTNNNADLSVIYNSAICYVQPSLYEGFGIPVLEAMTCGTPVVCTHVASLPEVAGDYAIYSQTTAESLAQAVEQIMQWPKTTRRTWIDKASVWAQKFSYSRMSEKLIEVYKDTLQRSLSKKVDN